MAAVMKPADSAHSIMPEVPVATIYQNSDQVAGVLQQLFEQPLIVDESRDVSAGGENGTTAGATATADAAGGIKVPGFGGIKVNAVAGMEGTGSWTTTTGTASRQQFVYSQAYYLHRVRQELMQRGALHRVASSEDADSLAAGSFVEYTTSFDPVELTLALEVITPELVDAITRFVVKKSYRDGFPTTGGFEAVQMYAPKMESDAAAKADFARAIATAVQADARQGTTREYYGRINVSADLTAITVCEREHFITGDPDRLLDGTFTVFGKVISELEEDVPTFARNKLLRNFSASAFDKLIGQVHASLSASKPVLDMTPESFLDLKLDSRVRGNSFRVLPLAIFS